MGVSSVHSVHDARNDVHRRLAVGVSVLEKARAHDPDVPELEVPEVAVVGDKPVAASSQQFIPDKEIVLQPQGRPAQILRLTRECWPSSILVEPEKQTSIFSVASMLTMERMSRSSLMECRSICAVMHTDKAMPI